MGIGILRKYVEETLVRGNCMMEVGIGRLCHAYVLDYGTMSVGNASLGIRT